MRKTRQILGLAAVALFGTAAQASAQTIDFHGGVVGCFFNVAPSPATICAAGGANSYNGLAQSSFTENNITFTYQGEIFQGASTDGVPNIAIFGGSAPTGFGKLTADGTPDPAAGVTNNADVFLLLNFYFNSDFTGLCTSLPIVCPLVTLPGTPTVVGQPTVFATVLGRISHSGASITGGFHGTNLDGSVAFTDADFAFTGGFDSASCANFGLGCGSGPWAGNAKLHVSLTSGTDHAPTQLGGIILVSSVSPEPGSIALFATGLVGMIPVIRYRRRRAA